FRRVLFRSVRDLQRTLGRLSLGSGNARDLVALRMALQQLPEVKKVLSALVDRKLKGDQHSLGAGEFDGESSAGYGLVRQLHDQISELPDVAEFLARAIMDE